MAVVPRRRNQFSIIAGKLTDHVSVGKEPEQTLRQFLLKKELETDGLSLTGTHDILIANSPENAALVG